MSIQATATYTRVSTLLSPAQVAALAAPVAPAASSPLQSPDQLFRSISSAPTLTPPYYGGSPLTLREKLSNAWRTLRIGVPRLFIGDRVPDPKMNLHGPVQKTLNRLLPGEIYMAVVARVKRTPAEIAIPTAPETRPLDPRWFMPNLVFGKKEKTFPSSADFDRDGNVNNNARTYRHGNFTGNQAPTVHVHAVRKGEYTVLIYSLYFADNRYANYHNHDWQPFEIYLQHINGHWVPKFLMTHWHHGKQMERWENLKTDGLGHPFVEIEAGAHALLPLKKSDPIKADGGWTMTPDGTFHQRRPNGQRVPLQLKYISQDANLFGVHRPESLPGGYNTMTYDKYFGANSVFGFFPEEFGSDTLGGGPAAGGPNGTYNNPVHPSLFFPGA